MIARMWAVLAKDVRTGVRDALVLYLWVGPLLLALAGRMLLPLLEAPTVTFAVAEDVPAEVVARFAAHGAVERLPDRAAVVERVRRIDDVPGVVGGADGLPEVILEGDEGALAAALPGLVLDASATRVDVTFEDLGHPASRLREILTALLTFSILMMGGVMVALVIVEERESKTGRVYPVSPLRFGEYAAAKGLEAAVAGTVLGITVAVILMGGAPSPVALVAAALGALPAALLLGVLIAALAEDQLAAVAVLKVALFFFTSLPVAGFFLGRPWVMVLWPFTNHWAIQGLFAALQPGAVVPWEMIGLSWLTGLPPLAVALWALRRRLGFGAEGLAS